MFFISAKLHYIVGHFCRSCYNINDGERYEHRQSVTYTQIDTDVQRITLVGELTIVVTVSYSASAPTMIAVLLMTILNIVPVAPNRDQQLDHFTDSSHCKTEIPAEYIRRLLRSFFLPGIYVIYLLTIMPLYEADPSIDHYTLQKVPEQFILFYSSIADDGQMWCPVDALLINSTGKFVAKFPLGMQGSRSSGEKHFRR